MGCHANRLIGLSLTWAAMLCPLIAFAGSPTPFSPSGELVLYRGATLIDGTDSPPRPDMDVLVAGERIAKVFPDRALDRLSRPKRGSSISMVAI